MYTIAETTTINNALAILENRLRTEDATRTSAVAVKNFLRLTLAEEEHEIFGVIFLDTRNRMIEFEKMFYGTLSEASVYPREVVKRALELNAASVIFTHNHPLGDPEPSGADIRLTEVLNRILRVVDVRVLDHIIVGNTGVMSFSEHGMLG